MRYYPKNLLYYAKLKISGYEEECNLKRMSLKSPISKVYELAQKLKTDVSFEIIKQRGKSHNKIFVMQAKLGHIVVTAEGKSKKEAKKAAAELVLDHVHELPGIPKEDYSVILQTKTKKKNKQKQKFRVVVRFGTFYFCNLQFI